MARKKERVKITKAVAKTKVVQKVTVNIGGRGGRARKSTAPRKQSRSLPLQPVQIFNSLPPPAQQGESMFQSAQVLNRLLEPVNMRLEALMRRRQDAPAAPQMVQADQRLPDVDDGDHRQRVLDLPDAPLIQPAQSLVPTGFQRMDDPHENVPIVDSAFEKREASSASSSAGASSPSSSAAASSSTSSAGTSVLLSPQPGRGFNFDSLTLSDAEKLRVRRRPGDLSPIPSLEEAVRHFGVKIQAHQRTQSELLKILKPLLHNRNK